MKRDAGRVPFLPTPFPNPHSSPSASADGKFCGLIKKIAGIFLDFIFPKPERVRKIEGMTAEEFMLSAGCDKPLSEKNTISIFEYQNPTVRDAIWEIKYWKNEKIGRLLAKIIHEFLIEEISDRELFGNFTNPILVPIPASRRRIRERGYNQCEFLCRLIEEIDGGRNLKTASLLRKVKETLPQTEIKLKTERELNIKGCFSVKDSACVKGKNIIILDDVTTTGSTIREARRALLEAGARKVIAFAVAH